MSDFISLLDLQNEAWRQKAKCRGLDPSLFFPERGDNATLSQAKKICRDCPVKLDCLQYAVENREEFGVWGEMTVKGFRKVRRQVEATGEWPFAADEPEPTDEELEELEGVIAGLWEIADECTSGLPLTA